MKSENTLLMKSSFSVYLNWTILKISCKWLFCVNLKQMGWYLVYQICGIRCSWSREEWKEIEIRKLSTTISVVITFVTHIKGKALRVSLVQVWVFFPAEVFMCLEAVSVRLRTEDRDKRPQHNRETGLIPCLFKLIS